MEIKRIDLDQEIKSSASNDKLVDSLYSTQENKISDPKNKTMSKSSPIISVILFLIAVGAGAFTGYLLKNKTVSGSSSVEIANIQAEIPTSGAKVGDVYGSPDEKGFKDKVTGVIDKGGSNGEGTHKLLRPGGASQTVYLASTLIDLDQLVGHQVTIWGETFKGQKVGWLMDVGRAKIEVLNAPLPE